MSAARRAVVVRVFSRWTVLRYGIVFVAFVMAAANAGAQRNPALSAKVIAWAGQNIWRSRRPRVSRHRANPRRFLCRRRLIRRATSAGHYADAGGGAGGSVGEAGAGAGDHVHEHDFERWSLCCGAGWGQLGFADAGRAEGAEAI